MKSRKSTMDNLTMQRRHFEFIASVIKRAFTDTHAGQQDRNYIAVQFAHELADTNPQFKAREFLRACGVPDEVS